MPIIWRFLLKIFLKTFILCMGGFIGILFVIRFKEIAQFATLNGGFKSVLLFSLYQIPFIIPYAIPISSVIAATILFKQLSDGNELTALRASGIDFNKIYYPLFVTSLGLAFINFLATSEISPPLKLKAKELSYRMTVANPFYIFSKISEGKVKNAYVEMESLKEGSKAKNILFIMNNPSHRRLGIMTAKEMSINKDTLMGKNVSFISSIDSFDEENYDHLIIENQEAMYTKSSNLSQIVGKGDLNTNLQHLTFRGILSKAYHDKYPFYLGDTGVEIARRLSLSFSPLIFTFMGAAFGISIGRQRSKKGLMWIIFLSVLFLACYVGSKSLKRVPITAWIVCFFPYIFIFITSIRAQKLFSKGME
jgi:lipopolysaccharide export system permease protein